LKDKLRKKRDKKIKMTEKLKDNKLKKIEQIEKDIQDMKLFLKNKPTKKK